MEEADLLKERIQAITDKRRIQEDIAKKRRQIEEEKLKFQYIKKKSLREQWLMDGLSQQSEEEQEAMRLQAQDEQLQSDQLQSNILRIEKEIDALEMQELNISANEEVVLKRLKEVERTPEDIIKDLNAEFQTDVPHHDLTPIQDVPLFIPRVKAKIPALCEADSDETKKATFAIKINVEHNKRTGKSQVLSTETVSPESIPERGLKVFDDGRKSVYALQSERDKTANSAAAEMTPTEVEELLHKATEEKVHTEVQYHQPVYSVPYMGTRPSTPGTPSQTLLKEKSLFAEDQDLPVKLQQGAHVWDAKCNLLDFNTSGQFKKENKFLPWSNFGAKTPQTFTNRKTDASPVPFTVRSEVTPAPVQSVYKALDRFSPYLVSNKSAGNSCALTENLVDFTRRPPICTGNVASVNHVLSDEAKPEPITMIFMGYENAADEEDDIQAELVMIGNSEDEDDTGSWGREEYLSFHPEGCKSKVFQPKVGRTKVTGEKDITEDAYLPTWEELKLHKPTFTHKTGKHSCHLHRQREREPANTCSTRMNKMEICSTIR